MLTRDSPDRGAVPLRPFGVVPVNTTSTLPGHRAYFVDMSATIVEPLQGLAAVGHGPVAPGLRLAVEQPVFSGAAEVRSPVAGREGEVRARPDGRIRLGGSMRSILLGSSRS